MMNEMENEIKILWDRDDVKDCRLVGYIECAKCELESVFGRSGSEINVEEGGFDDPKTQCEWWVKINGTAITIYDYKEDRPIEDDKKIMFHVGSSSIQGLWELVNIGFDMSQVLTREEFYNKRFGAFK
jgi:hypothetical protein